MDAEPSLFWDDLARDLEDPRFLREYVAESDPDRHWLTGS